MSQKDIIVQQLLDGLDELRPIALAAKEDSDDARSLLRRMVTLTETLQRLPFIEPWLYGRIANLLIQLFDAEHGVLLKHIQEADMDAQDWLSIEKHTVARQNLINTAVRDIPHITQMLQRSTQALGVSLSPQHSVAQQCTEFERLLLEHLQNHGSINKEMRLLVVAFQASIQSIASVLEDIGENSPELSQIQAILEQELPEDPKQAQALLREARSNILKAGLKLSSAGESIKSSMATQLQQMSELSERLQEAESQARNDPLTGLANRRKLTEFFQSLDESRQPVLFILDIDHFKRINDKYGHDGGDQVLEQLSSLLQASVRNTDMVARLGGEEFCIVLPMVNLHQGKILAEKIRHSVETSSFKTNQDKVDVKISIGIAQQRGNESLQSWMKRADEALYEAKENGRNQVVLSE
ncbi:MAG: hypothetical protein AUK35_04975 [Zetaproteobacteria bacterium CG2_30_46_52]|nr:MAG: hypothetical protein AUK35_04975 [Zetaproteobacteria bacterium CG2_30_46_52]